MNRRDVVRRHLLIMAASVLALAGASGALTADHSKVVDGIAIYFGVVPSEVITGQPARHPERAMHGGVPATVRRQHVMVALFDEATGERIEDATIGASVTELGQASQEKALEPMTIAGNLSYGNYFAMSGRGPYRIRVSIMRPGSARKYIADFDYRHTP